ncbi:hypothetical protein D9758_017336 [Tetrapyrgos nigripes]|uniref:Uncharacterized protein n=1 Tax=Tetrapyrgos nigripes TaxID=182062 RepID=A0A8H5FIJ9_9AGAR|nr:hypothetical protein D9758_017336 [Tetrapyrgos nigripes]
MDYPTAAYSLHYLFTIPENPQDERTTQHQGGPGIADRVKVEQSFHSGTRLSVPAQIPKFSETTSSIRHVTSQPASPAFHHHHDSAKHRLNPPKIVHS